jgi:hypothetical protein
MKKIVTKDELSGTRIIAPGKPKLFSNSSLKGKMFKFTESQPLIVTDHFTNEAVQLRDPKNPNAYVITEALSVRAMIDCDILVPCTEDGKELVIDCSTLASAQSEVEQDNSPRKSTTIRRKSKTATATIEVGIKFFDRRKAYVKAVIENNGKESTAENKAIITRVAKQIGDKKMPTVKMVRDWVEAYRKNGRDYSILANYRLSLN